VPIFPLGGAPIRILLDTYGYDTRIRKKVKPLDRYVKICGGTIFAINCREYFGHFFITIFMPLQHDIPCIQIEFDIPEGATGGCSLFLSYPTLILRYSDDGYEIKAYRDVQQVQETSSHLGKLLLLQFPFGYRTIWIGFDRKEMPVPQVLTSPPTTNFDMYTRYDHSYACENANWHSEWTKF